MAKLDIFKKNYVASLQVYLTLEVLYDAFSYFCI